MVLSATAFCPRCRLRFARRARCSACGANELVALGTNEGRRRHREATRRAAGGAAGSWATKGLVVLLAVTGLLLDGCASSPPVGRRVETHAPVAHAVAGPDDAELRPDMEALLREREEFFAPEGTVGATSSAPTTTRIHTLPRAGAIRTKRVARVNAMAFNGKSGNGPNCAPEHEPFAAGGRLCGDVRLPVATLTDAEMASVLHLLDDAENSYGPKAARRGRYPLRAIVRCDFDPHHALVLYDDAGEQLGTIAVCMTCHQWLVHPSSPGTGEGKAVVLDEH